MNRTLIGAAAIVLVVAACGTREGERTTGGAAAGAATGAGIGALGGPVGALAGAAIGAGAGAVTGATTSPSTLNLGEPPWSNPETRVPFVDEGNDRRRGRNARRNRDRDAQTAQNRREPRDERDRAYMGGGMVGDARTDTRAATPSTGTRATGTDIRPMPMGTTNQTR